VGAEIAESIRRNDMAKMPKEVMDMLNEPAASKVLATCDSAGKLNVVPKGTLAATDAETVVFGDIMGDKTNVNLKATGRAAVAVFKMQMPPVGYQVKGTFQGFQDSGPLFDNIAKAVKGALGLDIKAVGVIKVDEVYSAAPPNPGAKIA
jgi:predicted pyridoxine 5'-phosphate oxidase superfamily flavin-nucleotide-binding protein